MPVKKNIFGLNLPLNRETENDSMNHFPFTFDWFDTLADARVSALDFKSEIRNLKSKIGIIRRRRGRERVRQFNL